MHRTLNLTEHERLWDLRVRFSDFLRRFLACYRSDMRGSDRLTPDPFTVFFVQARTHCADENNLHAHSGLFGYRYFIDNGQADFLEEQRQYDAELPTEAIHSAHLPFPDGLCSWVYRTARSSAPTHVGKIFDEYGPIGNDGELKKLELTLLKDRTLMEVPIYDDLPMLGSVVSDGPSLILCIAIPNPVTCPGTKDTRTASYSEDLTPPEQSSYQLAEEQVAREMAHRMTRRFLSPVVSTESREWIGISPAMTKARRQIESMAPLDTPIILLGKTGTGKTEAANLIHQLSGRSQHPIRELEVPSDALFPDELYGHVRGAFTDARDNKQGKLREADGGTLMINEVEKLSDDNQVKLLRVIESGWFRPLGAGADVRVDVRYLVTCNIDLLALVKSRHFREDLYHRLAGATIRFPPLAERIEDIPLWAEKFLQIHTLKQGRSMAISQAAMERLTKHRWPGNLRELNMVIGNTVQLCATSEIGPDDLIMDDESTDPDPALQAASTPSVLRDALLSLRGETIREKLDAAQWILLGANVPEGKGE